MALPKKLKDLNLFSNGESWQGIVQSITLPTLTRKIEEWRGGGMDGAVGIDMGDAQTGENTEHQVTSTLSYYKLTIDGTEKIEIDLVNGVFKVNGVDRLAGRRQRLGI